MLIIDCSIIMGLKAANKWNIDLSKSLMIGDKKFQEVIDYIEFLKTNPS